MKIVRLVAAIMLVILIAGCTSSSAPQQPVVRLTLSTSGTIPAGQSLAGIGMTISLPGGVSPAVDTSGQVDTSVLVSPSGVTVAGGLSVTAVYIEAASGQPENLSLVVAGKSKAGFGTGECMILTLKRTTVANPSIADFGIKEFSAANLAGAAVVGLQAVITDVKLQ